MPVVRDLDPDELPDLDALGADGHLPIVLVHTMSDDPSLDARSIVRMVAARHFGVASRDVEITRTEQGKPLLVGATTPFAFNMSDADGHVAVAFGLGDQIGVDIERADRRTVEPERFARRVLGGAERAAIEGLVGAELDHALIRSWTRKEAVLKAAGHGLRRELADIDTLPDVVQLDGRPWNCWTTDWDDLVVSIAWAQAGTTG